MLTCGQSAEMCSHIAQVATGRKGCPLFLRWNLQAFLAIMRVEEAPDGLAILLNERSRIELGIDHHCVERCVTEEGLNNVHGRVVIQMFGGENAPAIVRQQHERRAVRALSSGADRKAANAIADGLNPRGAGMSDALEKIGCWRAGTLLVKIPVIADRNCRAVVEPLHMANDLGQDSTKPIANRNNASAIELRWLNVKR